MAVLLLACAPPAPVALAAQVACAPAGSVLRQRCTVQLTDRQSGRPVSGARVVLEADMPSMPLVHAVRPVEAAPVGPGAYEGTLELEMAGCWVIAVRVSGPVTDQFTHALDVGG